MRFVFAMLLLLACTSVRSNPNDTACQRVRDIFENIANRTFTAPQEAVALDAWAATIGVPAGATAAVKCQSILSRMHEHLKAIVIAKKKADQPSVDSSEVD